MNKRYRLGDIEEAVSEMEELIDIEDDIAEMPMQESGNRRKRRHRSGTEYRKCLSFP